jgi:hypothetical protein
MAASAHGVPGLYEYHLQYTTSRLPGFPPRRKHVARQQKALALAAHPAPPQEGPSPPCISPGARLRRHIKGGIIFGASTGNEKTGLTIAALSDMLLNRTIPQERGWHAVRINAADLAND